MSQFLDCRKHHDNRFRRHPNPLHTQTCSCMHYAIVAGFCIIGELCPRPSPLSHQIKNQSFVQTVINGRVSIATPKLFRCHIIIHFSALHELSSNEFIQMVEFCFVQQDRCSRSTLKFPFFFSSQIFVPCFHRSGIKPIVYGIFDIR